MLLLLLLLLNISYRVRYHGWLVALRGKLSHVARRGMIAFCWRKGALKNVNMLTISKSGCSYIPGKPLSSDLRHIIIDKIIDGGGNPLTMIFPGRFVNLVSAEHASVLGREHLLPPQPVLYSVNTSIYGWRSEFKDSYSDALSSFVHSSRAAGGSSWSHSKPCCHKCCIPILAQMKRLLGIQRDEIFK